MSNFNSAIANPTTTDTNFTTMDGKKSFKGDLTCGSSTTSFLEVSYTGTSDINVSVKLDKDLNGTKESNFTFSGIEFLVNTGTSINQILLLQNTTLRELVLTEY